MAGCGADQTAFFDGFVFPLTLNSREDYQRWLPEAALDPIRVDVVGRDMQHAGREGLAGWFRTTWFPYVHRVPQDIRRTGLQLGLVG